MQFLHSEWLVAWWGLVQQLLRIHCIQSTHISCDGKSKWCPCDSLEIFLFLFGKSGLSFTLPLSSYIMPVKGQVVWKS